MRYAPCAFQLPGTSPWLASPALPVHPVVVAGSKNLGAFVLSFLEEQQAAGQPPTAAALVEKLAETFPAFDDKALCQDKQAGSAYSISYAYRMASEKGWSQKDYLVLK